MENISNHFILDKKHFLEVVIYEKNGDSDASTKFHCDFFILCSAARIRVCLCPTIDEKCS